MQFGTKARVKIEICFEPELGRIFASEGSKIELDFMNSGFGLVIQVQNSQESVDSCLTIGPGGRN